MKLGMNERAPLIINNVKEVLDKIKDKINDFALSFQLNYHEANTIFYLRKVDEIYFDEYWIKISQSNGTVAFFNYDFILEYCIINADDVIDLGVV
ncbi:hypothetical protein [uncultured Methanobrevibacter sp.]|uniref:hypothetical protein n=1 Tax=uncultured Methanobrevibacter sp. TaxID=253161 RepID=UPI0025CB9F82|nr:hypothetical protein [uncultured Methanobrevibacter sp.]